MVSSRRAREVPADGRDDRRIAIRHERGLNDRAGTRDGTTRCHATAHDGAATREQEARVQKIDRRTKVTRTRMSETSMGLRNPNWLIRFSDGTDASQILGGTDDRPKSLGIIDFRDLEGGRGIGTED